MTLFKMNKKLIYIEKGRNRHIFSLIQKEYVLEALATPSSRWLCNRGLIAWIIRKTSRESLREFSQIYFEFFFKFIILKFYENNPRLLWK